MYFHKYDDAIMNLDIHYHDVDRFKLIFANVVKFFYYVCMYFHKVDDVILWR